MLIGKVEENEKDINVLNIVQCMVDGEEQYASEA